MAFLTGLTIFLLCAFFVNRKGAPYLGLIPFIFWLSFFSTFGAILLLGGHLTGIFCLKKVEKIIGEKRPLLMIGVKKYLPGYKIRGGGE